MTTSPQGAITDLISIPQLLGQVRVQMAFDFLDRAAEETTADLIEICEIPAPPFKEQARALLLRSRFEQLNLKNVHLDAEGNVIGVRSGASDDPTVVISAHLDTVFPEGTDVRVRREGIRLLAPGIGDNVSGLAALIALAKALKYSDVRTRGSLIFVATVGEEGEGDLRGARYLFTKGPLAGHIDAFISLDGPGIERITHQALGSRRYRVSIIGPGGHSWGDFGIVNPVYALGRAIARFSTYPVPDSPRTTYNIGVIQSGKSVNSIPQIASMDVDLRSASIGEIAKMEAFLKRVVHEAISEENTQRALSGTRLRGEMKLIGDRPSGETPADSPIVQVAIKASRALGIEPRLDRSSTDANIPISLGIPAITIGSGGSSGSSHSLHEWYDPTGRELGLKRALLILLSLVGIES